jgi:transglutaminase-like putative cysteine protease
VTWVQVFIVFLVCHATGDFLLQTEFQATRKSGGLGSDPVARKALLSHLLTYSLVFVPAFVWIVDKRSAGRMVFAAAIALLTHLVQDDRRLLYRYTVTVKKADPPPDHPLWIFIDQAAHLVWLFAAALAAAA